MYAPPRVETAADLSARVGRSERWIVSRTGVERRHVCEEPVEQMAAAAARKALGDGGPPDLIINASLTPVQLIPDTSVFVQQSLGWDGLPSFSVHATCLSFLVGLQVAAAQVSAGAYRRVLLVSAEQGTRNRDFSEPESAVLIGDGAGAAVIEPAPPGSDSALLAWRMSTWPSGSELAEIRGCGVRRPPDAKTTTASDYLFRMNGPGIFRFAYKRVDAMLRDLFHQAGLQYSDVALVVPHQASGRAVASIERLGFPRERTIDIVAEYGNCVAASLPMALAHAADAGRLRRGDVILLLGTGAGLSVAGALLRW